MSYELERGSTLGKYELLVRIGRGGMAGVWVARGHPIPGEPEQLVAVKAMLPELASNMEFRSMFLDEGQIVGSIDHPNVVRVYDVGEANGILFMAMEWVEGDSLHALIAEANKRRPIPSEVAVRLIADTASGLHAAHELRGWDGKLREIVHCDVSPHNILIGLDGKVKLVDFGVAGAMNQINNEAEVKIRGKFGYMSPEQAQAKPLDRRSDVFSLGIVLFELTTGYRLFRGRDDRHTLELVTWGKIPKPSQVLPGYPERLEAIVTKALERDPGKRFQTADEFRDALESYLVAERILVPAAGVKGLLRKVLGSKIDQRRQQVRAALRALDGTHSGVALVSEDPVASPNPGADEPVSVSVSEALPLREQSVSQPSGLGLGAAFLPGDGSGASGIQALSRPAEPRESRSNRLLLIGAAAGILIAGGVFLVAGRRERGPEVHEGAPGSNGGSGPAWPAVGRGSVTPATGAPEVPRGLSLDSLPPDSPSAAPSASAAGARRPLDDYERLMRDMRAIKVDTPDDYERLMRDMRAIKVERSDEKGAGGQAPDRVNQIAGQVTLDEAHRAGELDRAAAATAMARAAASTASCKRPGGASGTGQVLVTVAPSGTVQSASVSGPLAGTPEGACVAGLFRGVRIPPFSGGPVTLRRGFELPE